MSTNQVRRWTVCQHSAWVAAQDPQFAHGLEERAVTTATEARRVTAAGGVLFDTYLAASEFADTEMYPAGYGGLIPRAPGTFAGSLAGSPIYVPVVQVDDGRPNRDRAVAA